MSWIPRRRRRLTYRGFKVVDFGELGHPYWTAYQNAVRWHESRWWEWRGHRFWERDIDHFRLP